MPTAAVFIADNDFHLLSSCREHLENSGCIVYTANTPEEAQRKLESELQIDVAVIDIRLRDDGDEKDVTGLDIAKLRPDIPKIILTAHPDYQTTRIALKRHLPIAHEYLAKKEGLPKLMFTINWILERTSLFNINQDNINRTRLAGMMQQSFNQDEFNSLVFHLQEELRLRQINGNLREIVAPYHNVNNKVEEIIQFLGRHGQLILLLHLCRKFRPSMDWQTVVFL
jgi:DNA-binding NtrC family response regulator